MTLNSHRQLTDPKTGMAHMGDKFFVAYQHKGDYHDNFDSKMTFKIITALGMTWPDYCKHLERRRLLADESKKNVKTPFFDITDTRA
jgi:hypothetical protein